MMRSLTSNGKSGKVFVQRGGSTSANRTVMRFGKILSGFLQGVEDPLAE